MTASRNFLIATALGLLMVIGAPCLSAARPPAPSDPIVQSFPPPFCSPWNINSDAMSYNATLFDRADEAGLGGVRLWAWWKWMEPTQGNIDFTSLDQQVSAAEARGLKVFLTFVSIPPWANGSSPSCQFWSGQCSAPPTDPSYFADFVTAVVSRYGTRILFYGVWNEPNLSIFWNGPFTQYIQEILINGAAAIRAANPYARIVGPDTVGSTARFQRVLTDACSSLDILSVHDYPGSAATLYNHMDNQYLPIIQSYCNKKLWVTEFGIDSVDVGETVQANELRAALEGVTTRPYLDALFIYRVQDHAPWANPQIRLGIVKSEAEGFARKQAFWEVQDYLLNHAPSVLCVK